MSVNTRSLSDRFLAAQLAGDRQEALRLVLEEGLMAGATAPELHLQVIQRAQREIGRLWERNEISIAQEHVATAIANLALSGLYPHLPREERNGRLVLVACVEGEQHELGARIAADFLEMAGFEVRLAGANVPTEQLVAMATELHPDLVALSVTMTFHLPALRRAVTELRAALGKQMPIAVGGHAFEWAPDLPRQLDVDVYGTDAAALIEQARRVMGRAA